MPTNVKLMIQYGDKRVELNDIYSILAIQYMHTKGVRGRLLPRYLVSTFVFASYQAQ